MYTIDFSTRKINNNAETGWDTVTLATEFPNLLDAWMMGVMAEVRKIAADAPIACDNYNYVIDAYPAKRKAEVHVHGDTGLFRFNPSWGMCRFTEYGAVGTEYVWEIKNKETGEFFCDCHLVA